MKEFRKINVRDDVLPKLRKVKRNRKGWQACCPAHSDTIPSLSVSEGADGKVLFHCHAQGCRYEDILRALDLFNDREKNTDGKRIKFFSRLLPESVEEQPQKIVAEYDYTNEEGELLYQVVRYEPKSFRPRRPDGNNKWIKGMDDVRRVPYHLPEIIKAKAEGFPVIICEGERDVDNVRKALRFTATTTAFGANSWSDSYANFFEDLNVILLPDNDKAGRGYASRIAVSIWGRAKSIKIIQLPDIPDKGDVSDWIAKGGTREKLLELIDQTSEWNPEGFQEDGNLMFSGTQDTTITSSSDDVDGYSFKGFKPVDYLVKAKLTDTGNAECFATEYGDNFRYNKTNKGWHFWDNVVWKEDKTESINTAILDTIRKRQRALINVKAEEVDAKAKAVSYMVRCEDVKNRINIRKAAEMLPRLITTIDHYDTNKYLAATQNGTLDLKDGSFYQSNREDFITLQFGTDYDSEADCPRWKQFLEEIFDGDKDLINFIQKVIGYSLTGETIEQKMFILYGFGKNGKSVLLNTIQALVGDYAGTATFKTFDADKKNEQTNDLAMLKGKRFVAMSESAADKRLNEPLIKQVTGGDKITCRFLHKEFFAYEPQFKLFLATNHRPIITQTDFGIWRRIMLIPFTQNFEGREEDGLKEKLLAELPGILNWAIEGLIRWQSEGLKNLPKAVVEATDKYKNDSDTIGQWMEQKIAKHPQSLIKSSDAYNDYKTWAFENGFVALGNKTFKASLEERGYSIVKKSDANYWQGFGFVFNLT